MPLALRQMALTLLAERRKPSGECLINAAKPEGSRPASAKTQSKVSAIGLYAKWHYRSVRTSVLIAERRELPGEFPKDLRILTGQLALFRYKFAQG